MQTITQRPRGIFKSLTAIFDSVATAAEHTTGAVSEGAAAMEVLANTGKIMAENNREYVVERARFERDRKLALLLQEQIERENEMKAQETEFES